MVAGPSGPSGPLQGHPSDRRRPCRFRGRIRPVPPASRLPPTGAPAVERRPRAPRRAARQRRRHVPRLRAAQTSSCRTQRRNRASFPTYGDHAPGRGLLRPRSFAAGSYLAPALWRGPGTSPPSPPWPAICRAAVAGLYALGAVTFAPMAGPEVGIGRLRACPAFYMVRRELGWPDQSPAPSAQSRSCRSTQVLQMTAITRRPETIEASWSRPLRLRAVRQHV